LSKDCFFFAAGANHSEEGQPFDKLRADGGGESERAALFSAALF
jgi:hypothetical protein